MGEAATLFGSDRSADIDGRYRYLLGRQLRQRGPTCLFVMLNPSVADAERDDNTIACCKRVARREGAARLEVVNLFAWRAMKPSELAHADDPVGPRNDDAILDAIRRAHLIVAAWGAIEGPRVDHVVGMLMTRPSSVPLYCLARTSKGHPRHPRGVPSAKALEVWP